MIKKLMIGLPLLLIFVAPSFVRAEECVKPKDCYSQECAGLPSYPTFQFEACLTSCNATYWDRVNAYDTCVANQQTQQNMQQAQDQQPAQNFDYSEPAIIANPSQTPDSLKDEVYTVKDLKTGTYVKSKKGQRLTIPVPEGSIVLDESSIVQKIKDGWKVVSGKTKFVYDLLKKSSAQGYAKVTSMTAVCSVRGTTFLMDVDKKNKSKTTIRVLEGVVDVTDNRKKNKVEVKAGTQTVVIKGKKPSNPTTFDPGSLDPWHVNNPNE